MDWKKFFEIMIIDEEAARAKYDRALAAAENQELRTVLARLRDEEAFHVDYLQESWSRVAQKLGGS